MKKIISGILLLLCANSIVIADPVASLQNRLAKIDTMQASFKQKVFDENKKILNTYTGNMQFKKPNLFYWQVETPDANLLITDGIKLWNYDPDLEQVTVQKYSVNNEITPLSFVLDNSNKLGVNFNIVQIQDNCFKLTPKQDNSSFVNVSVCFNRDHIVSLQIYDHLGQTSVFEFSKVHNNKHIANEIFLFKPPAGVDVVGE